MSNWFRETPESMRALAEERALLEAAELISEGLEVRGITRSSFAKALGVVKSEVTQRLSGQRNLTVKSLAAMLHELDYDLELRSRDRRGTRHVLRASGRISHGRRYTTGGSEIRLVKPAA